MAEKKKKKRKYAFTAIVLGPVNSHIDYTETSMTHTRKVTGIVDPIEVKPADLYRMKPDIFTRIKYKLTGIDSGFLVVFKKDSKTPVAYENPEYSARVLRTVSDSRALRTALKDEFTKAMDAKTLFMYFLLVAGAIVAYVIITGQVSL